MAEVEQASLKSEQISDKSSSPALPDDLSLDEHTIYQLLSQEGKVCMNRGGTKTKPCDSRSVGMMNAVVFFTDTV